MRYAGTFLLLIAAAAPLPATEIHDDIDADTGWRVITAQAGQTKIRVVPAAGFNVFSIEHAGRELLKTPPTLADLPGVSYGAPLLYPSPNRVRNAQFTFADKTYHFDANDGTNFIHGLVHNVPWTVRRTEVDAHQAVIEAELVFAPGNKHYEAFPLKHTLRVAVTVRAEGVSWEYEVDNTHGKSKVPFGFALHPWILYQGERKNTFLTIPAAHWMEAENLLPTGKLVDLEGTAFDARAAKSLEGFVIDDVYSGMQSDHPTVADFRDVGIQLSLVASDDFTHLVVYTPENKNWFCVENQTCSTDAHNLYQQGLKAESHLLVAEPGETLSGTVHYRISDARGHKFSRWEKAIRKFETQGRQQPPEAGGTLFVGSSSIRFWDLPKYFPDRPVINHGFGGSQMIDSLYFADRIVLPYQPSTIVVYAGDNDIAGGQSPETVAEDFQRFARKIHAALPETKIVYIAIKPSLRRWNLYEQMANANALISAFADTDERITFADIAKPMLNEQGTPKPELFIKDGLHLSPAGYELWTSVIEPLLPRAN
ncbi:Aldose 1-epimerase [Symmachiella macrocystis]|uniref:Aldose 1-epimerase n=1 Tax=Symmachiella macrocystis TaxID=2527985 RepID=A0A5C6BD05_9PLAN|nr:GDSL-type esterase/lipase family protein [Symmachiella macrocystis]TWU09592.1 Aldose 1-epimerase [Symmachiella macrocystis]